MTSRNQLTGLVAAAGARPLRLDLMTDAEARELLTRRLGIERVAAAPDAVDRIVTRCARLPLALAVVAARAALEPDRSLAALAEELRATDSRLDALTTEDAATDVRGAFSWSYHALSPAAARLFRLLGLHPGPDVGVAAAASLAGMSRHDTVGALAELTRAHLITVHASGRYACHDLLRAYAAELAAGQDTGADRNAVLHRMFDHYLHTAYAAVVRVRPHFRPIDLAPIRPGVTPEQVSDSDRAQTWFTAEHATLLAAVTHAARTGFDTHAWQLALTLTTYLHQENHWADWAASHRTALDAARRLADRPAAARVHSELARAYTQLSRYDDADTHCRHALDLAGELGDVVMQADIHLNRGWLFEWQGRRREAMASGQRALDLYRAADHRLGQARALNVIGWHRIHLGDVQRALDDCHQALALLEEIGDPVGRASTWDSIAYAHHRLGQYAQAVDCYRRALELMRGIGNRYLVSESLIRLGETHHAAGDPASARDAWQEALRILEDLAHPDAADVRRKLRDLTTG